jgi:hypothetical protein
MASLCGARDPVPTGRSGSTLVATLRDDALKAAKQRAEMRD